VKTANLKVGIKGAEAVQVPLRIPENTQEMLELCKGSEEVLQRCFKRGWAIENQERSGARDTFRELHEAGKPKDEIIAAVAKTVADYDPTSVAARGGARPRKPVEIKAGPGGKLSMDDFLAQLAAAGVKVNINQTPA
jgi:hypothetical protein